MLLAITPVQGLFIALVGVCILTILAVHYMIKAKDKSRGLSKSEMDFIDKETTHLEISEKGKQDLLTEKEKQVMDGYYNSDSIKNNL